MYKLFNQLDRQRQDEEKQQDAVDQGGLLRRDSFSTISTHETEILIAQAALPLVTWGDGNLPMEIAVPDYSRGKVFIGHGITPKPNPLLIDDGEGTNPVLPTTLLLDDDEDFDLIFADTNEEDTQDDQPKKPTSLLVDDDEDFNRIFTSNHGEDIRDQPKSLISTVLLSTTSSSQSENKFQSTAKDSLEPPLGTPPFDNTPDDSIRFGSDDIDSIESSLYTRQNSVSSMDTPDDVVRFELKGFTRFEI
jgi:hypothetical protein